jgi:hypothetical protein
MDRPRYATGREEDVFPYGVDWPLSNKYEELPQAEQGERYDPTWDNDYGEAHQRDSVGEEAEARKPL